MSSDWLALYFPEDESISVLRQSQALKRGTCRSQELETSLSAMERHGTKPFALLKVCLTIRRKVTCDNYFFFIIGK